MTKEVTLTDRLSWIPPLLIPYKSGQCWDIAQIFRELSCVNAWQTAVPGAAKHQKLEFGGDICFSKYNWQKNHL